MTDDIQAIRLDAVAISFGATTLTFDCSIKPGGITAVAGASGSGKSTLFNLISGFEAPDRGRIHLFGRDCTVVPPGKRDVSVIFQDHNLFAHLDVATNIGLGIHPAMRLTAGDRLRIAQALERVGLAGFERRMPPGLSGGERQRVAIARALVRARPLLLMDEPFGALDPELRMDMLTLVRDLQARERNTVMFITHQPDDIRTLADRVLFLTDRRILLDAPVETFLHETQIPAVARFLHR